MYRICINLFLLFGFLTITVAQQSGIRLLCGPRPDSILLRWAPADRHTWELGNRYGYIVERYTLLRDGKELANTGKIILTPNPLKPAPLSVWEKYEDNKYAAIAAECIFGKDSIPAGSNPHLIARRYQNDRNRFSFALYAADQSLVAARLSGLFMADRSAAKNEKYLYRVYIPVPGTETPADTASAFTGMAEYQELPQPLDLKAKWGNRKVELSWNILYLGHIYNSYIVEKSENGDRYTPLNENASVQLADDGITPHYAYKTDSLAGNKSTYHYRVRGVSAFGEIGPPCKPVSGRGRIPITQAPAVTGNQVVDNRHVALQWSYPDEMNEYISGFRIYRSDRPTGPKEKLHECRITSERTYTDEHPGITNYYAISVFNDNEECFTSTVTYAELVDSIPPAIPAGLAGVIDTTGKVRLSWNRNIDADIDGYRIYRANHSGFEFMLINPAVVTDTTFIDSINIRTLTRNIHYKIKAVDQRQNLSGFSMLLTLTRPDVTPPVSPVISDIHSENGKVTITWVNSTSEDVARHHLYRKEQNDTAFVWLTSLDRVQGIHSVYHDTKIQTGKTYIYYATAEDQAGLSSPPSSPVQAKIASTIVENIQLQKEEYTDKVELKWNIRSGKEVVRVLVYRSVNDAPLELYGNSTGAKFTDDKLSPGKTYLYRVKAVYLDESTSQLSNPVKTN